MQAMSRASFGDMRCTGVGPAAGLAAGEIAETSLEARVRPRQARIAGVQVTAGVSSPVDGVCFCRAGRGYGVSRSDRRAKCPSPTCSGLLTPRSTMGFCMDQRNENVRSLLHVCIAKRMKWTVSRQAP